MGPKINSVPICLGCHRNIFVPLGVRNFYKCSKCKWPLCGIECESSALHARECALMAERKFIAKIDFDSANPDRKESAYCTIMPLRCILLKEDDPKGLARVKVHCSRLSLCVAFKCTLMSRDRETKKRGFVFTPHFVFTCSCSVASDERF